MLDPAELPRIATAAFSAGAIVLFGAFYAVCLALGRLKTLAFLLRLSLVAYAGLVVATAFFTWAMNLTGWWLVLVVVLLIGYFVAPRAIWRLSVATHESTEPEPAVGGGKDE